VLCWTTYSKGEEYRPFIWLYHKLFRRHQQHVQRPQSRLFLWFFYPKLDATGDPMTLYFTAYLVWIYAITGYLFLIATRFHYTVDVFIGFLLSILTWKYYHFYIKTLFERSNIMITRFFIWFEGLSKPRTTSMAPEYHGQQTAVPISILTGPLPQGTESINGDVVQCPGDAGINV
ncbi:unnamed protein product, partial [Didymodactylos carnosus]